MSVKIDAIVKDFKENNLDYKLFTDSMIKKFLISKYKCSAYIAKQVIKKLSEDEKTK